MHFFFFFPFLSKALKTCHLVQQSWFQTFFFSQCDVISQLQRLTFFTVHVQKFHSPQPPLLFPVSGGCLSGANYLWEDIIYLETLQYKLDWVIVTLGTVCLLQKVRFASAPLLPLPIRRQSTFGLINSLALNEALLSRWASSLHVCLPKMFCLDLGHIVFFPTLGGEF